MTYQVEITPFRLELCFSKANYNINDIVIIKSSEGIDIGRIAGVPDEGVEADYGEIVRLANDEDLARKKELRDYEEYSLIEFKSAIDEFEISMKPVYAHCQFDEERIIFYFTSEKRLEFRRLHRYISQKLNKRVVIKQIGVRDYSKLFGGIGPCGRTLCCASFLKDLKPVSLRKARDQKLYLSPSKLSGNCGKLLCCLNFEKDFYTRCEDKKEYNRVL